MVHAPWSQLAAPLIGTWCPGSSPWKIKANPCEKTERLTFSWSVLVLPLYELLTLSLFIPKISQPVDTRGHLWRSPTRFGGTDTGNSTFARQVGGHSFRVFRRNFVAERKLALFLMIDTIELVCTSPRCRCALRYVCTSFCTRSAIESRLCKEPWLGNFKHGAEDLADTDRGQGQWDRPATRFWKVQQHSATLSSTLSDPVIFFNSHSSYPPSAWFFI